MLGRQLRQGVFIGRKAGLGLPDGFEAHLVEQHGGQLLGGIDIELPSRQASDRLHHAVQLPLQLLAEPLQHPHIQTEPVAFDLGQHRHQRHLHLVEQAEAALLLQPRFQQRHQPDCHRGCFSSFRHHSCVSGLLHSSRISLFEEISRSLSDRLSLPSSLVIPQRVQRHRFEGVGPPVGVEEIGRDHRVEPGRS